MSQCISQSAGHRRTRKRQEPGPGDPLAPLPADGTHAACSADPGDSPRNGVGGGNWRVVPCVKFAQEVALNPFGSLPELANLIQRLVQSHQTGIVPQLAQELVEAVFQPGKRVGLRRQFGIHVVQPIKDDALRQRRNGPDHAVHVRNQVKGIFAVQRRR